MARKIGVASEVDSLRKVIIHYPDDGVEVVTPSKALEFLYDDIVFLPKMREEHTLLRDTLCAFLGRKNVFDTENLLYDVIKTSKRAALKLISAVCEDEGVDDSVKKRLMDLKIDDLIYTLFTGQIEKTKEMIFPPLPNNIFTRDIGVVVNDHVIICQASKDARTRENIITRSIIYYHPLFKSMQPEKIIDLTVGPNAVTLEGGDIMMFENDYVLVGVSERSTPQAFDYLKKQLFEKGVVNNVVRIEIPKNRACMHIDTIFTQISKTDFVVSENFCLRDKLKIAVFSKGEKQARKYHNLKDFIKSVIPKARLILCGNGQYPFDEREQWTDGCNLVAVKDGVAIAYERNEKTQEALEEYGYRIVPAEVIVNAWKEGIFHPEKIRNTIITIPATELSRARGGPHCMTFPVLRIK